MSCRFFAAVLFVGLAAPANAEVPASSAKDLPQHEFARYCREQREALKTDLGEEGRLICADIGAVEQTLVYNRFGSFNPFGMIFALKRDLVAIDGTNSGALTAQDCDGLGGADAGGPGSLTPGNARLRDCKRPRPLVLRANVGDMLLVRVENLLKPEAAPDFSSDFCKTAPRDDGAAKLKPAVSTGDASQLDHREVTCPAPSAKDEIGAETSELSDWPATRGVNFVVQGLMPLSLDGRPPRGACMGFDAARPGEHFECLYRVTVEGPHFLASNAAPTGGEGAGGGIVHGLFGAIVAERAGTRWYRGQLTKAEFDDFWTPAGEGKPVHARQGDPLYEVVDAGGVPLVAMARPLDVAPVATGERRAQAGFRDSRVLELVHTDLNGIVYCDPGWATAKESNNGGCDRPKPAYSTAPADQPTAAALPQSFREFSVFFHDELKTFYTRNFEELGRLGQLAGVRDGFGINYGASGMGALLLANRKGIGPAASCAECLYEEFFLSSWANGDPALLEWFPDDPSNVHHSYLNDPVVFRNFHAGPKETHVFHLHAHQWFAGNDPSRGSYLDSQTVAPQQGFTYNIYSGGLNNGEGGWQDGGSGNRNRTVGDSIFHCHLYPHFAQGMWALWRVHDVLEDGSRKLPDGQAEAGLSLTLRNSDDRIHLRMGSVDPVTGRWIANAKGTPVPALVPLPGEPLPLLPLYAPDPVTPKAAQDEAALRRDMPRPAVAQTGGPERIYRAAATETADQPETVTPAPEDVAPKDVAAMPGYPFYIGGQPGHRPPQPPLDMAKDTTDSRSGSYDGLLSGGLGRHVVTSGEAEYGRKPLDGDRAAKLAKARAAFDAAPSDSDATRKLERLSAQLVARAFALGDLSGHLKHGASITTLDEDGTPLERAAMGFHHDGEIYNPRSGGPVPLAMQDAFGNAAGIVSGGYASKEAPRPDEGMPQARPFMVNGAPPKPGAPFADPCGGAPGRNDAKSTNDPLDGTLAGYFADRDLAGFRRYEASAVQFDMIVNGAGWHDPQARVNVLTADGNSDRYKKAIAGPRRASPTISDQEEPFFFRALSGECIEFRHTNELPKELDLDDFQVRTPTDTIGQHIHLVKFDVTSSDGSGNGWNYEDGTFAPDEIMSRRCAATNLLAGQGTALPTAAECKDWEGRKDNWRLPLSTNRDKFQTTVQRWFADPMTTRTSDGDTVDRTMRTVFSHDHFGPSSIQQHGFYTALLIEPRAKEKPGGVTAAGGFGGGLQQSSEPTRICQPFGAGCETGQAANADGTYPLQQGTPALVGAHRVVLVDGPDDPLHPDYREFALAIADFALLYDPRDRQTEAQALASGSKGMARLLCEGRNRRDPRALLDCASAEDEPALENKAGVWRAAELTAPAWLAGGMAGDGDHNSGLLDLITRTDLEDLSAHFLNYRRQAAGMLDKNDNIGAVLASPVAPPERPEAISVDHHDPYLVNYRNAPIPVRIGTELASRLPSTDCEPKGMNAPLSLQPKAATGDSKVVKALKNGGFNRCSLTYQMSGDFGDLGWAFSSWGRWYDEANPDDPDDSGGWRPDVAGREPDTPILPAVQGDRMVIRLIQGAQEVQHTFNVAGLPFRRNIDQIFSQGMTDIGRTEPDPRADCFDAVRISYPEEYEDWLKWNERRERDGSSPPDAAKWDKIKATLARCDNVEGYNFAQAIGISEHFEMRGRPRADVSSAEAVRPERARLSEDMGSAEKGSPSLSDYLYNFGSIDSLWNGAWGFIRVHVEDAGDAPPPVRGFPTTGTDPNPANPNPANPNPADTETASSRSGDPATDQRSYPATCPLPSDERGVTYTTGIAVALRTADVWPGGTDFGNGQSDPDGLMLALLPSDSLSAKGAGGFLDEGALRDDGTRASGPWKGIGRAAVIAAVKAHYGGRAEPFVMRVNAGDCVQLRYINLLGGAAGDRYLPDGFGDALMPRIAPLNVDPVPLVQVDEGGRTVSAALSTASHLVRPSTMLGLSIGLPGGELIRDLPLGYGRNRQAMEAGGGTTVDASPAFSFYAGRMRLDVDKKGTGVNPGDSDATAIATYVTQDANTPQALAEISADSGLANITSIGVTPNRESPKLSILGQPASLAVTAGGRTVDDPPSALIKIMQARVTAEIDRNTHWIPYAFGPVPVRATGDMISHVPHGLIGVIDVLPQDWPLAEAGTVRPLADAAADPVMEKHLGYDGPVNWRTALPVAGFGAPVDFVVADRDQDGLRTPAMNVREYVLFWQDGLNLRDRNSPLRWSNAVEAGNAVDRKRYADAGPMVPNCLICDDSYDFGDAGVSYRSPAFAPLLRAIGIPAEASDDLNHVVFPPNFLRDNGDTTLSVGKGQRIVIRVVDPGGRARQHSFVMNGYDYDDLFPGFGFPHSALVGPGLSVSAWLAPKAGECGALWHDGPLTLFARGLWGRIVTEGGKC